MPTNPPPAWYQAWKLVCWVASRTSPVVLRKTTTSWLANSLKKTAASLVSVTPNKWAVPSSCRAVTPAPVEVWTAPEALVNTKTSKPCPNRWKGERVRKQVRAARRRPKVLTMVLRVSLGVLGIQPNKERIKL